MNLTIQVRDKTGAGGGIIGVPSIDIGGSVAAGLNHTAVVADNTTVLVTVTLAGYLTYSQMVKVYDYDFTMQVRMLQNGDPDNTLSWIQAVQAPCSYTWDIYLATNAQAHLVEFAVDGATIQSGVGRSVSTGLPVGPRTLEIETTTYDPFGVVNGNDTDSLAVTQTEWQGVISFTLNPTGIGPFSTTNPWAVAMNDSFELIPTFTLNNTGAGVVCATNTIDWEITDSAGTVVASASHSFVPAAPPAGIAAGIAVAGISTPGTYTAKVTLENCCITTVVTQTIYVTADIRITETTTCGAIEVTNFRAAPVDITLLDHENQVVVATQTVASGASVTLSTGGDGLFFLMADDGVTPVYYMVPVYCSFYNSWMTNVRRLMCDCHCNKCENVKIVEQRRMLLAMTTALYANLQAAISVLYGGNYFWATFITGGSLDPVFHDVRDILEKLRELQACLDELLCDTLRNCSRC